MRGCFRKCFWILGLAAAAGTVSVGFATPYWTPEQIAEEYIRSGAEYEPPFILPPSSRTRSTLDERAYFAHYRMLCDFLVSMQYAGAGANNGGMIEGESDGDQNIIQTDNTQEAIRVWSQYAIWTADTARYGPKIRMAQGYCQRFPAWREGDGYYSIHNCGWGFEAERKYRAAYNDTSWTWYADSCAWWVVSHPLSFNPDAATPVAQLNPCAEGLGIGGLYPHTLYRNRFDWQNFAISQARLLRRWFESNPVRLNASETWALCGGTALWGICESLFRLYPDSGATWLMQYAPQLDIWHSSGEWNHSHNTWYCNAHHVVFELTQDSTYWENAVYITDSLIGLDTDHDGGIPPGRNFPATNDHSWVSAYMGWMGMERIINQSPIRDVAVAGFISPSLLPHLAGDTLLVAARVVNHGVISMNALVTVSGLAYYDSLSAELSPGADTVFAFSNIWVLPDDNTLPAQPPLTLSVAAQNDANPANDTMTVPFDIRRSVPVAGSVFDSCNPAAVFPIRIEFFHDAYPDSVWAEIEQQSGVYSSDTLRIMAGWNRIRVIPKTAQLMIGERHVELISGPEPQLVDFPLPRTDVALIDDDAGDAFEEYFLSTMDSFDVRVRWWDVFASGMSVLDSIPNVIWFTGNDSLGCLDSSEQDLLENYLDGGGNLLLTGQNITDALGHSSAFLTEVLRCSSRTPDTDQRMVRSINGYPPFDSLTFYLVGTSGAWNQNSSASVWPLEGSTAILRYAFGNEETCGIAGEYGSGRYVFLSFGLEAVSGASNSTTRDQFIERCFIWFDSVISAATPLPPVVAAFELFQNFPNPFNPATQIRFLAPRGIKPVRLTVYNILGQEVCRLYDGIGRGEPQIIAWNGTTTNGAIAASGLYIYRLQAGSHTAAKTLYLLR